MYGSSANGCVREAIVTYVVYLRVSGCVDKKRATSRREETGLYYIGKGRQQ